MNNDYVYKVQDRETGQFKTAGHMWSMSKGGKLWPLNHFKAMLRSACPFARWGQRELPLGKKYSKMHQVEHMDVVTYELKEVNRVPLLEWIEKEVK